MQAFNPAGIRLATLIFDTERSRPPDASLTPGQSMDSTQRAEPALVDPLDLAATGAALCSRFGEPDAEACRLSTLHDVLKRSRALAHELDEFTKAAGVHYRGIHCAADMRSEVQRLHQALLAWSESVFAAGSTYREWREGDARPSEGPMSTMSTMSTSDMRVTPLHPSLADARIIPSDVSAA
jgi:hypothetical protein